MIYQEFKQQLLIFRLMWCMLKMANDIDWQLYIRHSRSNIQSSDGHSVQVEKLHGVIWQFMLDCPWSGPVQVRPLLTRTWSSGLNHNLVRKNEMLCRNCIYMLFTISRMADEDMVLLGACWIVREGGVGANQQKGRSLTLPVMGTYVTSAMHGSKHDHISPQNSIFAHKYIHTW